MLPPSLVSLSPVPSNLVFPGLPWAPGRLCPLSLRRVRCLWVLGPSKASLNRVSLNNPRRINSPVGRRGYQEARMLLVQQGSNPLWAAVKVSSLLRHRHPQW